MNKMMKLMMVGALVALVGMSWGMEELVTIETRDGVTFKISISTAKKSRTLKNLISRVGIESSLILPSINSKEFLRILTLLASGNLLDEKAMSVCDAIELVIAADYLDYSKQPIMEKTFSVLARKLTLDSCVLGAMFPFGSTAWSMTREKEPGIDEKTVVIAQMIQENDLFEGKPRYSQANSLYEQLVGYEVFRYADYLYELSLLSKERQIRAREEGSAGHGIEYENPSASVQLKMAMLRGALGARNYANLRKIFQQIYAATILPLIYQEELLEYLPKASRFEVVQKVARLKGVQEKLNVELLCPVKMTSECKRRLGSIPLQYRLNILSLMIENSGLHLFIPEIWAAQDWKGHAERCRGAHPEYTGEDILRECKYIRKRRSEQDDDRLKDMELIIKLFIGPDQYENQVKSKLIEKYQKIFDPGV